MSKVDLKNQFTLYVGDLDKQVDEQILMNLFSQYGKINSLRIMKDLSTKLSRGFAFVSYFNQNDAQTAKDNLNSQVLFSRSIRIAWKKNIREISPENNIFVKCIPLTTTQLDENGNSRGYGYVQFETKESAQICLQQQSIEYNNQKIEIYSFCKKEQRPIQNENNLYFKNLPQLSQKELETKLQIICEKFGHLVSIYVKQDQIKQKSFAFVCFKNNQDAQNALQKLQDTDPFKCGEKIYVNWSQKKKDRQELLEKQFQNFINETNIFTKNLKDSVTLGELQEIFSEYGEINSCVIKKPQNPEFNTQYAFIDFKKKQDAKDCILKAQQNEQIQQHYENKKMYLNIFMNQKQLQNFQQNKVLQRNNYSMERINPEVMQQLKSFMFFYQSMIQQGVNLQQHQTHQNHSFQNHSYQNQQYQNQQYQNKSPQKRVFKNMPQKKPITSTQRQNRYQKSDDVLKTFSSVQILNEKMKDFLKLEQSTKRKILGELLFPQIQELAIKKASTPRITGMLIDLEIFDLEDILEIINNKNILKERVIEAEQLIDSEEQQ